MFARNFSKNLLAKRFSVKGGVFAKNKAHAVIEFRKDHAGLLSKIMDEFKKHEINMNYIDGKIIEKDAKGQEKSKFNICYENTNPKYIKEIESIFDEQGLTFRVVEPPTVPWFPTRLRDLDIMGTELQDPNQGLNDEHPGFSDKAYRKKRD